MLILSIWDVFAFAHTQPAIHSFPPHSRAPFFQHGVLVFNRHLFSLSQVRDLDAPSFYRESPRAEAGRDWKFTFFFYFALNWPYDPLYALLFSPLLPSPTFPLIPSQLQGVLVPFLRTHSRGLPTSSRSSTTQLHGIFCASLDTRHMFMFGSTVVISNMKADASKTVVCMCNNNQQRMPYSNIDRIHSDHRPVVTAPLEPTHLPVVQRPITKTHDIALARAW